MHSSSWTNTFENETGECSKFIINPDMGFQLNFVPLLVHDSMKIHYIEESGGNFLRFRSMLKTNMVFRHNFVCFDLKPLL